MRGWLEENAGYSFFQIDSDLEGMFTGSDLALLWSGSKKQIGLGKKRSFLI